MIQRDYFIRIIEEFMAALGRFLEKKEDKVQKQKDIEDLYRQYVGDYNVIRNLSFDELLIFAQEQYKPEEMVERLQMMAYLLETEGRLENAPLRDLLLNKAYKLFDYIDANDKTFSMTRKQKINQLRKELNKQS